MDYFFEPRRSEVIDLSSDDEDIGYSNCQKWNSSISYMPSSRISFKLSSKAPANTCAWQEIHGAAASGGSTGSCMSGENNLIHGGSFTHPQACNSPSSVSTVWASEDNPPWVSDYTMNSDNSFPWLKQKIKQHPPQMDDTAVHVPNSPSSVSTMWAPEDNPSWASDYAMNSDNSFPWLKQKIQQQHPQMDDTAVHVPFVGSPKLYSEEGLLLCRQSMREVQVPSFPPYEQNKILAVNEVSVPPQSENVSNGSIQMNRCVMPGQLPLFHQYSDCRENRSPAVHPVRMQQTRNSEWCSSSDLHFLRTVTPSVDMKDNLLSSKHIKLENTFASHTCQTGSSNISANTFSRTNSSQGLSRACPEMSTSARNGITSRKIGNKAFGSSLMEVRENINDAKDEVSGSVLVDLGDKPVKMKWKDTSAGASTSDIHLLKAATLPISAEARFLPPKRLKLENKSSSHSFQVKISEKSSLIMDQSQSLQGDSHVCPEISDFAINGIENKKMDTEPFSSSSKENHPKLCGAKDETLEETLLASVNSVDIVGQCEEEERLVQIESYKRKMQVESKLISASSKGRVAGTKLGRQMKRGLCLIDSFTPEKVREHIRSLRHDQEIAGKVTNHCSEHLIDENTCSLCGMKELYLDHPPKYCGSCLKNIHPKGTFYYIIGVASATTYGCYADVVFCTKCYRTSVDSIMVGKMAILKTHLEKTKDSDDFAEPWVQCGKCEAWQHQICALFNDELNKDEISGNEHTCPSCFLQEMEAGIRKPLPHSQVLSAENLPATKLSDHVEEWLFRRLKKERQDRANTLGKNSDEVQGTEGLVVRVVSSIDKTLNVNENFRKIFQEKEYPAEFPYKSKAIILFQKIDGADVCLFAMYVQEFGSDCAVPNQRRVCISYIDSVKYFRPVIKAATGESLRTFVYHEILIGYLGYCKKRGFTSCSIWSCPPAYRDDYILYRHPTTQKIPKSDSLRGWYEKVIQKAEKETIVVEHTNLYDHYFKPPSDCKAKVTASRLPYFDGDYWPGQAEKFLQEDIQSMHENKETTTSSHRVLRNAKRECSSENPEDVLLMHRLEEKVRTGKKNFMIVHLQHSCKHCCQHIVSGSRWVCNARKNFHLCDTCYSSEQMDICNREKYSYTKVKVESVPIDTNDEDGTFQSEHFDTRMMFLNLCKSKYYQFDTLRRAKHSTMMILYHLHNTVLDCNLLRGERERRKRIFWKGMHDLFLHAYQCFTRCAYRECRSIKRLFRHAKTCSTRASGGCKLCKKIEQILKVHATRCKQLECTMNCCRLRKGAVQVGAG